MTPPLPKSIVRAVALAVLLAAGCGNKDTVESFKPPTDTAREALTAALDAWQGGQAEPGEIEDSELSVQMTDPEWAKGAKLKSYEIVEELPNESPPKFAVKLTLDGAPEPAKVTYVVVGKATLWVMTEAEFNRSSGM